MHVGASSYGTLPASLFESLQNQSSLSDQVGLVFTSYSTTALFPLRRQYSETSNSDSVSLIGSSVLAMTVVADEDDVKNLTEPVVTEFRVNNSVVS